MPAYTIQPYTAMVHTTQRSGITIIICFNHQLHLVVAHAMEIEPKARNFFALCQQLYVFFKRQFASNIYEGQTLKRLLVQRLLHPTILNIFTQVRYLSLSFAAFLIEISYQVLRFTPHGLTLLPHRFLYDIDGRLYSSKTMVQRNNYSIYRHYRHRNKRLLTTETRLGHTDEAGLSSPRH